jgi:RNA polymerase sigma factor (sigma-70 family)
VLSTEIENPLFCWFRGKKRLEKKPVVTWLPLGRPRKPRLFPVFRRELSMQLKSFIISVIFGIRILASPMDLETLLKTKIFLEEISLSIRNILLSSFPEISPQEKEDIDIEVKMKLWKKAAGGKEIGNLRSYLWRVVYTTALDLLEERMSHLSLEKLARASEGEQASEGLLSSDSRIEDGERRLMLRRALDSLPERRQAVLRLHFEGMDIAQIAARLQWRENQVRHLLYRGLADIKEMLRPAIPGAET